MDGARKANLQSGGCMNEQDSMDALEWALLEEEFLKTKGE